MKKVAYVTNIPTPYRDFRFRLLSDELKNKGIELIVHYMGDTENGRNWSVDSLRKGYVSKTHRNIGFNVGVTDNFYLNPGLWLNLLFGRYDTIIVGGISSPSHILCSLVPFVKRKIVSVESNLFSTRYDNRLLNYLKKIILNKYQVFQVTGNRSKDYIEHYLKRPLASDEVIYLPNIINETDFDYDASNQGDFDDGVRCDKVSIFCAARLEHLKGIKNFIESLEPSILSNLHIYIAGDGSQRETLVKLVKARELPITFLGYIDSDKICTWYKTCDLFLLPSIRDPSPLSPIEALFNNMPLLISRRIGNKDEVLIEGENGFSFDILEPESIREAVKRANSLSKVDVSRMGLASSRIYREKFEPNLVITNYVRMLGYE